MGADVLRKNISAKNPPQRKAANRYNVINVPTKAA
jgi:hypothetical protein